MTDTEQTAAVYDAIAIKRDIEERFEKATGLSGRSWYSAVYSLPQKSSVLWINLNPGGTPDNHSILSDEELAAGKHEFFDGHGKTSQATGDFLTKMFNKPTLKLRSIQGTNVAWERSKNGGAINLKAASSRAAPFLAQFVDYVEPELIIFGGANTFDLFMQAHKAKQITQAETLMGNWGPRTSASICVYLVALGKRQRSSSDCGITPQPRHPSGSS